MRYVDLEALREKPSAAALIEAAREAGEAVAAEADPETRRELIKGNRTRWNGFRGLLEESNVGAKCWYTESCNSGTDDDVDHYRPKNGVTERTDHPGYWWEALNWKNFRLSCHRANRLRISEEEGETLGKGKHFPILDEQQRWMEPGEDCSERPSLLDPTDPEDPQLLTFLSNGRTGLAPAFDEIEEARERYEQSRRYLHLDWERFVEDRSGLYAVVTRLIERGDESERRLEGDSQPLERARMKQVAQELIRLTKPDREYSAAAIAYIRIHQDRAWVRTIVLPNI